ncbi:MAG: hypothetical protein ACHQX3_00535 [Nitrospirales bacterium]|jgi:hypothetical protein
MPRYRGINSGKIKDVYTPNLKVYNVAMATQEEVRDNWVANGQRDKLAAWHELPLEKKREHLAKVRKFRLKIYEENTFQGVTIRELAERYKVSHTYISQQLMKHAAKLAKKRDYDIPAERIDQYNKLKMLMDSCYTRALEGDDFAIKSYVTLAARFAKVIGLDAPTKFQHEVNKKVQHSHTHTIDIEDIEKRLALVKARQKQLAERSGLAAPILVDETIEKDPVSAESSKSGSESGSIGYLDDDENVLNGELVEAPERFLPEEPGTIRPVPEVED